MSKESKTTEFSLHLSRSKMRRYLNDALSQQEEQEVELHLSHCSHCSAIIVSYVENEEAENYKAHMNKLKGKLSNDVKPRQRKFTHSRIKVIRAAAAVVALFVFSFFALTSLVEKDFNLISKNENPVNELPKIKPSQKKVPKQKASTQLPAEKKTDDIEEEHVQQKAETKPTPKVVEKKNTPSTQPKVVAAKPQEEAKESAPKKVVEKTAVPDNALAEVKENEKKDDTEKKEEQDIKKTTETEKEEVDIAEETIQPIQKIDKIDVTSEKKVGPEAQNTQSIPNNSVGQLRP